MARYVDEQRYDVGYELDPAQIGRDSEILQRVVDNQNEHQIGQVTPDQVTADQNNYTLPDGELVRLSTDASRTFTGFAGARPGRFVLCNVGANDLVIANNNVGSDAQNRVLCHTGANITLNPNESVTIIYDFLTTMWRTIGFV